MWVLELGMEEQVWVPISLSADGDLNQIDLAHIIFLSVLLCSLWSGLHIVVAGVLGRSSSSVLHIPTFKMIE